ncbi:MAG: hypothetical protein RLZZ437_1463 [Pseudomonadota bacterium]
MRHVFRKLLLLLGFAASPALALGPTTESWATFIRDNADQTISTILVDLEMMRWLSEGREGFVIALQVDFAETLENGLPSPDALNRLYMIEEKLVGEISRDGRGRLMGHLFGQGRAAFHLYIPKADDVLLAKLNAIAATAHPGRATDVKPVTDALMKAHVLFPTMAEYQIFKDGMVLGELAKNGDIATKPRQIDHWAYFPDRQRAEDFAASIKAEGMTVISVLDTSELGGQTQVKFNHVGTVLPEDISAVTVRLAELAAHHAGGYDGWETFVMRQE